MKLYEVLRKKNISLTVFLLLFSLFAIGEEVNTNSVTSIMLETELEHNQLISRLTVSDWQALEDQRLNTCKYYVEEITLEDLIEILNFDETALVKIDYANMNDFSKDSIYWKTCNYEYYTGDENTSPKVPWFQVDSYIETELSLLLVKNNRTTKKLTAMLISKPRQFSSAVDMKKSMFDDVINFFYVLLYGHPKN